jgi:hypothetical protein
MWTDGQVDMMGTLHIRFIHFMQRKHITYSYEVEEVV